MNEITEVFILTQINQLYRLLKCILKITMRKLETILQLKDVQHEYEAAQQYLIEIKMKELMDEAREMHQMSEKITDRINRIKTMIEKIDESNRPTTRRSNRNRV